MAYARFLKYEHARDLMHDTINTNLFTVVPCGQSVLLHPQVVFQRCSAVGVAYLPALVLFRARFEPL